MVGNVGTVSRIKGTDVFLNACRRVLEHEPDIRFELLGAHDLHHDPGLDSELAGILSDRRTAAGVTLLGQRPATEFLSRWDIAVSASRSEAFPLAVLEAMAAGLPVIATGVGGVPEQIEHLRTGVLVPPEDPEAIAAWILKLFREPGLRARLGHAAAMHVATEFTIARQAEGLHRAYLTALGLRFGPPVVRSRIRAVG
jgi:glycosyltransferase involved in cell wall biosynthesis